jgi:hypothetical protein
LNLIVDELARQVKRHRDKLRHRRDRAGIGQEPLAPGETDEEAPATESQPSA